MACNANNLSALAYANGFTLFHYRTSDPIEEVDQPGYFDEARPMFRLGLSPHVGNLLILDCGDGEIRMRPVVLRNGHVVLGRLLP